jgi:hypothetical protein
MTLRAKLKFATACAAGVFLASAAFYPVDTHALAASGEAGGWISLFDGSSLNGWDGRSDVWKVEDGAITGEVAGGPSSVTDTTCIF